MINTFFSGIIILLIQASIYFGSSKCEYSNSSNNSLKTFKVDEKNDNPVVSPQDILFMVKHNQSPNVVIYQANKINQNALDDKKPINVFWLMNTKGKTTENLTIIEWKLAFGFKLSPLIKGKKYKISLNAIKQKEITIIQDQNGKVEGFMKLNGYFCKLKSVFIQFEPTFYIPDVKYVDISGNDTVSGKLITERIIAD